MAAQGPFVACDQVVKIGGEKVYCRDCRVRRSYDQKIADMEFVIEDLGTDLDTGYQRAMIGAPVEIQHTVQLLDEPGQPEITRTENGEIIKVDISSLRGDNGGGQIKKISARSNEIKLQRERLNMRWENKRPLEIIRDLLPSGGITEGYIEDVDQEIPDIEAQWDTPFTVIEEVAKRTNHTWRVFGTSLYFFSPGKDRTDTSDFAWPDGTSANDWPESVNELEILEDTLDVNQDGSQLANVLVARCWEYMKGIKSRYSPKPLIYTREGDNNILYVGECISEWCPGGLPDPESPWEVTGQPMLIKPERYHPDDGSFRIPAKIDFEEGSIKLDEKIILDFNQEDSNRTYPMEKAVVEYDLRRPVQIERRHTKSIGVYGERWGEPVSDDGGWTVESAVEYVDEMLQRRAWPTVEVSCDVIDPRHDVDRIIRFQHQGTNLDRYLYVASVDRQWTDGLIRTSIELRSPDTNPTIRPETARVDPVTESVKRIRRLERQLDHSKSARGTVRGEIGSISSFAGADDEWVWDSAITYKEDGVLQAQIPLQEFFASNVVYSSLAAQIPLQRFRAEEVQATGSLVATIPLQKFITDTFLVREVEESAVSGMLAEVNAHEVNAVEVNGSLVGVRSASEINAYEVNGLEVN